MKLFLNVIGGLDRRSRSVTAVKHQLSIACASGGAMDNFLIHRAYRQLAAARARTNRAMNREYAKKRDRVVCACVIAPCEKPGVTFTVAFMFMWNKSFIDISRYTFSN